jgi:hypothetical protein
MSVLGFFILVLVSLVVLRATRGWALVAVMAGVLYLTQGQVVEIAGVSMFAFRFVEIAGVLRVISRGEFAQIVRNPIDRILVLLYVYIMLVNVLRGTDTMMYHIGIAADTIMVYLIVRALVQTAAEWEVFLIRFLVLLIPYTCLVLMENVFRFNVFSALGGVEFGEWERAGRLRSQGSFRHPSLLGTLGASFLPLYIGVFRAGISRRMGLLGIMACAGIVWASNSGGPASMAAVGLVGWLLWPLRGKVNIVKWIFLTGLMALFAVMKAPIWYLPAKVSAVTGGDGWHRSYLMDIAFQNVDRWWLAGMPIHETSDWFPYKLDVTGGADITNGYLSIGFSAGVLGMGLFVWLLICALRRIGAALQLDQGSLRGRERVTAMLWGLGVTVVAHGFNWLGITYFDQSFALWLLHLCAVGVVSEAFRSPNGLR